MQGGRLSHFREQVLVISEQRIPQPREHHMADESNPFSYLKEIGAAFKLGSGVLGKSAIAFGILVIVGGIAVYRLKSDAAIIGALVVLLGAFFLWFFPVLRFVEKHPEAALLESAEWMEYHRFQAAAKGYLPTAADKIPTLPPGNERLILVDDNSPKNNEEKTK
jgi:hypothetical protein